MKDMKLYKRVPCGHCEYTTEGKALGCLSCHHLSYRYEELTLADLPALTCPEERRAQEVTAMDMAALGVLGETKDWLQGGIDYLDGCDGKDGQVKGYRLALQKLIDLESSVDLGAAREIQIKARAWDNMHGESQAIHHIKALINQARRELEAGACADEGSACPEVREKGGGDEKGKGGGILALMTLNASMKSLPPSTPFDSVPIAKDTVSREAAIHELETIPIGTEEGPELIARRAVKIVKDLPAVPDGKGQEPDYEAILKGIEEYMRKEEYRLRTEGYAMVSGASRGENFLKELKAKHTPVRKKGEGNEV